MKKSIPLAAISVLIIGIFIFSKMGCSDTPNSEYNVVVIKFATHPALNDVENNFVTSLQSLMKNVKIKTLNAHGDPQKARQLAISVTNDDTDLIVSLATPATQAVSNTKSEIPLLFGAVSDPIGAKIDLSRATGITNVDTNIIQKGISIIKEMYPSVRTIGSVYNPTEQNSIFVQNILKQVCDVNNIELIQRTVSSPTQYQAVIEGLAPSIDVLYCSNDNMVNRAVTNISRISTSLKLPFIIGELSAVSDGPLAGVGVKYSDVGEKLGLLAKQILTTGTLPALEGPTNIEFWLNSETATKLDYGSELLHILPDSTL